jgi:hypothetical protein
VWQQQLKPIADAMAAIDPDITLVAPDPALLDPELVGDDDTEDALKDYAADNYLHAHYWFGTCKMGPYDLGGVVDSSGRVYKTENLWVADASVFPIKVCGSLAAPCHCTRWTERDLCLGGETAGWQHAGACLPRWDDRRQEDP